MRRVRYLLLMILLVALPVLGWAFTAYAQTFRHGDSVTVPSGQTVNSTLFAAGRTLDIAGNVNGDLFCAGENVTVSGRVRGDVICAAQNLTVNGQITGDVRLVGQNVTLGGTVTGNATVAAQSFVQQSQGNVLGDMTVIGQDATLNGKVGRDVAGSAATLTIGNLVGRNVMAKTDKLRLNGGAMVRGNVTYTSRHTLDRAAGSQVNGDITHHTPAAKTGRRISGLVIGTVSALYLYVACVLAALVLALLLPGLFERAADLARGRPGMTVLIGLLGSVVVPVVLLLLMFTVIGIPLALLAGLAWLLLVLLAGPFAAYWLGRHILRTQHNAVVIMLTGSAILFLLYLLPFVGWIFWLAGTWLGLGMLLRLGRSASWPRQSQAAAAPAVSPAPKGESGRQ